MTPSIQQQALYDWILTGRGSAELLARAGCGKTTTLMGALTLIYGKMMGSVALMAYNKTIALELKERIAEKGMDWKLAQAGTCHSFGLGAWKAVAKNVIVDENKVFNIVKSMIVEKDDVYDKNTGTIVQLVSYAKARAIGYLEKIDNDQAWISIWEHFGMDMEVAEDVSAAQIIAIAKEVYRKSLLACYDVIDFDDMILAPLYHKAKIWPKDWVMLDESQDTNPARRALALKLLKPKTGRLIFVGDDRQAIYGFTGADSDAMASIKKEVNAITLPLSVTYRCPKAVVKEAQRLVPDIEFHESNIEGSVTAIEYESLYSSNLTASDAVLCRNTAPLITLAYDLLGKGIACRVEGREIGTGLIKLAKRWNVKTLVALEEKLDVYLDKQRAKFIEKGQEERIQGLEDQTYCLKVVINRCKSLNKYLISDLVDEIEGMFGNTKEGEAPKVLTLSTIHKSKGREWERVFVLGREKFMPSPYARKPWQQLQEQNLEYVAITRAKVALIWVSVPKKEGK